MKIAQKIVLACLIFAVLAPSIMAQQSLKGMTFNGSTGIYTVPTGRIGWERSSDLGIDFGYHSIIRGRGDSFASSRMNHLAQVSISLFKLVEISTAFDFQPRYESKWYSDNSYRRNSDMIIGAKFQLPIEKVAIAFGSTFQVLNMGNDYTDALGLSFYGAATYAADFFNMPAETTLTMGYTIGLNRTARGGGTYAGWLSNPSAEHDIDFGMGWDLTIFPKQTNKLIHWLIDVSNFTYSLDAWGAYSIYRATVNTGLRFDLSAIPALKKFKFVIDVCAVDLFDEERSFSFGLTFGVPIL